MISRNSLDCILDEWARYYLSEFNSIGWSKTSMSGKIIEFAKLGITVSGTQNSHNFEIPGRVEAVFIAVNELENKYSQVIKTEYAEKGTQKRKALKLSLNVSRYRNRLFRARKQLINTIT